MLAWHVACNSIVTYSNYAHCRSVGMETVAWRCDRALAMRSSFGDAIELASGDVNYLLQACPRS